MNYQKWCKKSYARSLIKKIQNMHTVFERDISHPRWDSAGPAFQEVRQKLQNANFIKQIVALKDIGKELGDHSMKADIEKCLGYFKQMSKAVNFIDVATQDSSSILNTMQTQMVKSILEGKADPLNRAEVGKGFLGTGGLELCMTRSLVMMN